MDSEVPRYSGSKHSYVFPDRKMVEAAGSRGNGQGKFNRVRASCDRVLFVKQGGYYLRPEDKLRPIETIGEETSRRDRSWKRYFLASYN